jgi:hypothetical protein
MTRERTAYILVDEASQNGKKFKEFLRITNSTSEVNIHQLQLSLLASIFSTIIVIIAYHLSYLVNSFEL